MEEGKINIKMEQDIKAKKAHFFLKRIMDFISALIGIIILSPIFIAISIWIKIDSKGPVIFKQIRVGRNEELFKIYKFRTMVLDAEKKRTLEINPEDLANFVFQSKTDNRITKVGAFLRKTSLDEIPQLFNVLIGNMSLVGPRPEIPEVVQHYPKEYKQRLLVPQGITGLAQVSGRGEIELGKTIEYDLTYIKNFTIWYDIILIFKTFLSVVKKDGAF